MSDCSKCTGDILCELLKGAKNEVLLVSPFIKEDALIRIFSNVREDVKISVFTRWRLVEIAMGVSDIEIWKMVSGRKLASLYLITDLHAKYYRADDHCLFGSANITKSGLGWAPRSNLELLGQPKSCNLLSEQFETMLVNNVMVDESLYRQVKKSLESMDLSIPISSTGPTIEENIDSDSETVAGEEALYWTPNLRHPQDLYLAYAGKTLDLISISRKMAALDLSQFSLVGGMQRDTFEAEIGIQLLQKPIIMQVDSFLEKPRRFGEAKNYLGSLLLNLPKECDPEIAWQSTIRWLRYFLPFRYKLVVPNHSEVIFRVLS